MTTPHNHNDEEISKNIMDTMPSDEAVNSVSEAMKQLGDPSRLRIFWILCHTEECVIDIAAMTEMSSPAVSHHLRLLKTAGLIEARRAGKEMYYKASDTLLVRKLHKVIEEIADITCPD